MDEEDRVVQLLASLPESYDMLVTALEACENVPSMEIVIDRLLYEKKKSRDRQGETETDREEALAVRSKPKWKRGVRCRHCGNLDISRKSAMNEVKGRTTSQTNFDINLVVKGINLVAYFLQ